VYIDQLGVPIKAEWADNAGILTLSHREEEPDGCGFQGAGAIERRNNFSRSSSGGKSKKQDQQLETSSNGGSRRSGEYKRQGSSSNRRGSSEQQEGSGILDLGSPDFKLDAWLQSLKSLRNPDKLAQVDLPLKVRKEVWRAMGQGQGIIREVFR
jgi:hypothetical protein